MRASRLLAILLALRVRGRVSAGELAAEHGVSLRTIYRDLEALGAAGVPVYAVRGRHGGYRLVDGFRRTVTALSRDEAGALALAGLPTAAADLGLGSVLAAAQLKLQSALPPELRQHTARVAERFLLDTPGWLARPDSPALLAPVADAVWSGHQLHVTYQRSGRREPIERTLAPLGLVLKAGSWYLVAAASVEGRVRSAPRTFRVSRILTATRSEVIVTRPATFRLPSFWSEYRDDYERRVYADRALVRLGPRARELAFLLGRVPSQAIHSEPPDESGWTTASVPIESVEHALHALLQLGDEVEVMAPAALRERMITTVAGLAARYAR
jgi:predicted DNA-binding transcriptional regulator YafY